MAQAEPRVGRVGRGILEARPAPPSAPAPRSEPPRGAGFDAARVALVAHLASLAVAAVAIGWLARRQWFFYDEWEFITNRVASGHLQLFAPHVQHWSTIPILVYRALYAVVGLHSYLPYLGVLLALHLAAVHLVWRVLRRSGVDAWIAAALPLVLLFLGASQENFLWAFQVTYLGSVVFGLMQVLLADRDGGAGLALTRRDVAAWAAGVAALMCSGIGLTFLAVATLVALFRRGVRAALITASVPFAAYLAWFLAAGRAGFSGDSGVSVAQLPGLPRYVGDALVTTVDQTVGFSGAGVVIVAGLGLWLLLRARRARVAPIPFAAALGAVVLFALIGVVRMQVGSGIGARYIYPAVVLLLPAAGLALDALARRRALLRLVFVGLAAAVAVHGLLVLRGSAQEWALRKGASEQRILAAGDIVRSGATVIGTMPEPQWAPDLTTGKLRALVAQGALPPGDGVSGDARMDARAHLLIAAGGDVRAGAPAAALAIRVLRDVQVRMQPGGTCFAVTPIGPHPEVGLSFDRTGVFMLTTEQAATVDVFLRSAGGAAGGTGATAFATTASTPLPIEVTWADAEVFPHLPTGGADTICAAAVRSAR